MGALSPESTDHLADSVPERILTNLGVFAIATLCLIICIVVLSRWFFRPVIPDDVLLVREFMVAVIILPLASVTSRRMHIAVTVFTEWTSVRTQKNCSTFGKLIGVLFVGILLWANFRSLFIVIETGEYYDGDIYIPIWIGYLVCVLGLEAFFLRLLASILRPEFH